MNIRYANPDDAASITAIYNPYITGTTVTFETEPLSVEVMRRRIETLIEQESVYLVAEEKGCLLGYAYAHPWKERAAFCHTWETTVYVSPDSQGKGVGTKLMKELIAMCKCKRVHALVACITSENKESLRMHERLGFRQVSHFKEVGYKFGRWLDVVDYELLLNPTKP